MKVSKKFGFISDKYTIDLEVGVENSSTKEVQVQLGLDWIGKVELEKLADEENKDYGLKYAYLKNQKMEKKDFGGAGASGCTPGCTSQKRRIDPFEFSEKGEIGWYAFQGEYFAALMIPSPGQRSLTLKVVGDEKNLLKMNGISSPLSIPPKQVVKIPYRIYLGPKEMDLLKELGTGAERLVDFGFFSIVAKPGDRRHHNRPDLETGQHRQSAIPRNGRQQVRTISPKPTP